MEEAECGDVCFSGNAVIVTSGKVSVVDESVPALAEDFFIEEFAVSMDECPVSDSGALGCPVLVTKSLWCW